MTCPYCGRTIHPSRDACIEHDPYACNICGLHDCDEHDDPA